MAHQASAVRAQRQGGVSLTGMLRGCVGSKLQRKHPLCCTSLVIPGTLPPLLQAIADLGIHLSVPGAGATPKWGGGRHFNFQALHAKDRSSGTHAAATGLL